MSIIREKMTTTSDMRMVIDAVITTPQRNTSFTLHTLRAPRFWPVSAETAMLIDRAGMKATMSTLPAAPKAFVAAAPKELTKADMKRLPMETRDCCTMEGKPILKRRKVRRLSRMSLPGWKAIVCFFRFR